MNDIEERLKAFNLDDVRLQAAMRCVQANKQQHDNPKPYVVETIVVRDGKTVVTSKEETNV